MLLWALYFKTLYFSQEFPKYFAFTSRISVQSCFGMKNKLIMVTFLIVLKKPKISKF